MRRAQTSGGRTTWPPGNQRQVAAEGDVDRVGQAADRAAALVELRDVDLDDLEAPVGQLRADPLRGAGGHHDRAADHDRVGAERRQRLLVGEHQRLGHQLEQRRPRRRRRRRPGQTIARRSSSGQKARSRWYIAGWVIRTPRTRTSRSVARCLSAELLGARAVARDQRVAPGEHVAGLEVGADAVATDVRRGAAAALEPRLGRRGLHPALGVAHVRQHDVAVRAVPWRRTTPRPRFIA